MKPHDIDVNVHPTKKEVGFSNQEEIAEALSELIEKQLGEQNDTINFGNPDASENINNRKSAKSKSERKIQKKNSDVDMEDNFQSPDPPRKTEPKSMVRVDHRDITLDHFIMHGKLDSEVHRQRVTGQEYGINNPVNYMDKGSSSQDELIDTPNNVINLTTVVTCNLLSIRKLIYEFDHDTDEDYAKMFKAHAYVGMINYDQVLIQYETCLLLVNVYPLVKEFIYQQVLYNFQNYGKFTFAEPLDLRVLLKAGLEFPEINYCETENMRKKELVEKYIKKFNTPMGGSGSAAPNAHVENTNNEQPTLSDMLKDYFGITIVNNHLCSLPKIVKEIPVYIDYLPVLIVKIAALVDYTVEVK
jgi:DNA mismatch repair protein MLH1